MSSAPIRAVFFDVGETLLDETSEYGRWADRLGVPRHTFSAVFGAVISAGRDYREAFEHFRPGFDLDAERAAHEAPPKLDMFYPWDLYPDAQPCMEELQKLGILVGVAGNQTAQAERILRLCELPIDVLGSSASWGVEKPSSSFFERLITEAGFPADGILYVGDRPDQDLLPAMELGLQCALIMRGPWAHIAMHRPEELARCLFRLDDLTALPELVAVHNSAFVSQKSEPRG